MGTRLSRLKSNLQIQTLNSALSYKMSGCCDEQGSCSKPSEINAKQNNFDIPEKFKSAEVVDVLGDQQVLKLITKKGSDSPARATAGCTAILHYTGTLTNGNKFDSSRDRGEPFETPVAQGRVIKGWDAVMPTMAKGERAEVLIQSECAYGANGSPPSIPGGAALIFDMEMIDWFGEDISESKNKSLTKIKVKSSEDYKTVDGEDLDEVTISLSIDDKLVSEKLSWVVGEEDLVEGVDKVVSESIKTMTVGEKSIFTAKKFKDYNNTAEDKKYEIEVLDFKAAKRSYEMDKDEALKIAEEVKGKGTEFFKAGKLEVAKKKYDYVIKLLDDQSKDWEESDALKLGCMQNLALIALKLKNYYQVVTLCDDVLAKEGQNKNEKALFRKGEALYALKEYQQAQKVYKQVLEVNPDNKLAKKGQINSQKQYKAYQEAEKKKYSKMFG